VAKSTGFHFFTIADGAGPRPGSRRTEYLDDVAAAARLVWAVAAAIHHAHQHGVLHRDTEAFNVLVDDSGVLTSSISGWHATWPNRAADGFRRVPGTPAYAAPEQLREDSEPLTWRRRLRAGRDPVRADHRRAAVLRRNLFEIWSKVRESDRNVPGR